MAQFGIIMFLLFNILGMKLCLVVQNNDHEELLLLKEEVQSLKAQLDSLTSQMLDMKNVVGEPSIAFLSELSKYIDNPAVGRHIVFDAVHLNRGNAYNNIHGFFTAPVNGTYHFSLELTFPATGTARKETHVQLKKGSEVLAYVFADGTWNDWIKRSATALVDLYVGDEVNAVVSEVVGNQQIAGCCMHSTFSGYLVRAM